MAIRQIILLSVLCVILLVTSASAECAWVLWGVAVGKAYERRPDEGRGPEIALDEQPQPWIVRAYPTYANCDFALNDMKARVPPRGGMYKGFVISPGNTKIIVETDLTCLPDTVDPRAPKAK